MAYQNMTAPAEVLVNEMAATRSFFARLGAGFSRMGTAMMQNSSGARRVEAVRRLQAKSDTELAALKIKREDIVGHVFKDVFYM